MATLTLLKIEHHINIIHFLKSMMCKFSSWYSILWKWHFKWLKLECTKLITVLWILQQQNQFKYQSLSYDLRINFAGCELLGKKLAGWQITVTRNIKHSLDLKFMFLKWQFNFQQFLVELCPVCVYFSNCSEVKMF